MRTIIFGLTLVLLAMLVLSSCDGSNDDPAPTSTAELPKPNDDPPWTAVSPPQAVTPTGVIGSLIGPPLEPVQINYLIRSEEGVDERLVMRQTNGARRYDAALRRGGPDPTEGRFLLENPDTAGQRFLTEQPENVECWWLPSDSRPMALVNCGTDAFPRESIGVVFFSTSNELTSDRSTEVIAGRTADCYDFGDPQGTGIACVDAELAVLLMLSYNCRDGQTVCYLIRAEEVSLSEPGDVFGVPVELDAIYSSGSASGEDRVELDALHLPEYLFADSP